MKDSTHRSDAWTKRWQVRACLLPKRGFQMPSIAHKFSPVNCSVSYAFLGFFVSRAVLKNASRVLLPWTSSQNARRKNCYKMERNIPTSVSHEHHTWIIVVHIIKKYKHKSQTKERTTLCFSFTEFLANSFGLNTVLVKNIL